MCIPDGQLYPFENVDSTTVTMGLSFDDAASSNPISLQTEFRFFNQSLTPVFVSLYTYVYAIVAIAIYSGSR